ncbi:hypothetical protein LPAF129_08510 [Ligilactobacillus pabuli]|uniref:DUF3290 domain-containing protein n=1 Tax=Ligilactobacillus pabuli TaxID=2886039 RepID=A0ABQ5JJS3_9LACO|nr:DUF3290 domain-containing protein [Ligilactobacillus pabuli]GKS81165.1 hypothetical protein LPAF129_08510 [Ligilactobacillus pabuli]HIW89246.1 DUF3290 domain-containing protein [Candidatus Ligilactobacillus excrementipullorum]
MQFYTYQYLVENQAKFPYLRVVIITVLALSVLGLSVRYLRNKGEIKYKDLAVIAGTMLILFLALQFNDYTNFKTSVQQSGQQVELVKKIAHSLKVKPERLSVNQAQTGNGDLLIKSPKGYYRVLFSSDNSGYMLEKVELTAGKIEVKGD